MPLFINHVDPSRESCGDVDRVGVKFSLIIQLIRDTPGLIHKIITRNSRITFFRLIRVDLRNCLKNTSN